jgi:hypothetical protein
MHCIFFKRSAEGRNERRMEGGRGGGREGGKAYLLSLSGIGM